MFSYDRFAKTAAAAAGALVLSVLTLSTAVGPVNAADIRAIATASASDGAANV